MRFVFVSAIVALAGAGLMQGQSARQLYYQEDEPATPKEKTVKPPKPAAVKPKPPGQGNRTGTERPKETGAGRATTPPPPPDIRTADTPQVQLVSAEAAAPKRIGLRYSLLRIAENGDAVEISPDSTFRSGDMVGVRVEVNRDGYLYIVSRGTSGNWKLQFPSPEINGGENRVLARRPLQLPSDEVGFVFDDQPGEEQLFVVYSSQPVREIESLIYSLREPEKPESKLLAQNVTVGNDLIANLRRAVSRDLLTQRISKTAPAKGADPENAVYVATLNSGRLVADIRLTHK